MEVYCTRPGCPRPQNYFPDLDDSSLLKTVQQRYCKTCGMPLILSGRYLPVKLLGQGGFGAAFLARDRYTPAMRQCVAKLLQPSVSLTPAQLRIAQNLFEREAAVLEELGNEHPQIPSLLAFFELTVPSLQGGKNDQFFYLVQEFIDGENLEQELAVKGKFSEAEMLVVLREILKVLDFVHSRGSIHRDIKPANIWVERKSGRVKILDFGLARTADDDTQLTQSGAIIGTPAYMAPEQGRGERVDHRCDLFSLGCLLFRLCTGQMPFKGNDTIATLMAVAMENPKRPNELNRDVPSALSRLIMQLLAKDKTERPATAEKVAATLLALQGEKTVANISAVFVNLATFSWPSSQSIAVKNCLVDTSGDSGLGCR